MRLSNKILAAFVVALAIVFFAFVAFSVLDNYLKAFFLLVDLVACGALLKRLTGVEGYYGLLLLRGEKGFKTMRVIATRFARESRFVADWGFAVGFGVPYSLLVFRKHLKRFLALAVCALAFEAFFFFAQPAGAFDSLLLVSFALAVLVGLFGLGFFLLAQHAFAVLTVPGTTPGVTLLIPFLTVPWQAVFAIIIIAVVHELAHGVLCNVERLRLKSSGLLLFGFLPVGAFVEPDEEKFKRITLQKKRRILSAGSASNLVFFLVFLVAASLAALALQQTIASVEIEKTLVPQFVVGEKIFSVDGIPVKSADALKVMLVKKASAGEGTAEFATSASEKRASFVRVVIQRVRPDSPAAGVLHEGEEILRVNAANASDVASLRAALANASAGDVAVLETSEGVKRVTLAVGGKLGVELAQEIAFDARDVPRVGFEWVYVLLSFLAIVFSYTFMLNFVLALVNLLPIIITDGQRIIFEEFSAAFGKKNGFRVSLAFSAAALALLALNALPWFLK